MPRGRKPGPGTTEERAAARRERVRLNVQAFRKRKNNLVNGKQQPPKPALRFIEDTKWQQHLRSQSLSSDSRTSTEDYSNSCKDKSSTFGASDTGSTHSFERSVVLSGNSAVTTLLHTPKDSITYTSQLYALLPDRFLPQRVVLPTSDSDSDHVRTPCSLWITTACKLAHAQSNSALRDVVMAVSLALMSMEHPREDLQVASQRLYSRSLAKTRGSLDQIMNEHHKFKSTDMQSLFLSCHASAIYEMLVNGSAVDTKRHVNGIGLLIEQQRQHPEFPALIGEALLEEYRMLEINFSLLHRQLSVSNRLDLGLKRASPKSRRKGASVFSDVLDLANQIPPYMVKIDSLQRQIKRSNSGPVEALDMNELRGMARDLLKIHLRISSWSHAMRRQSTCDGTDPVTSDITTARSVINIESVEKFEFAACWLFCLGYALSAQQTALEAILLIETRGTPGRYSRSSTLAVPDNETADRRAFHLPTSTELRREVFESACAIIALAPFFFSPSVGLVGHSVAGPPVQVAWIALEEEWMRLSKDEMNATANGDERTGLIDLHQIASYKQEVAKQVQLCKSAATKLDICDPPTFWIDR